MHLRLCLLLSVVCLASARPQNQYQQTQPLLQQSAGSQGGSTPIAIVNQTQEVGADGTYNFSYGTANGIYVQENGYLKKNPEGALRDPNDVNSTGNDIQVVQGSVSYTAPDGQVINLSYIADENGFQPQGDHIPTAPNSLLGLQQNEGFRSNTQQQFGTTLHPGFQQSSQFGSTAHAGFQQSTFGASQQTGFPQQNQRGLSTAQGQFGSSTPQPGFPQQNQVGLSTAQGQFASQQFGSSTPQPGFQGTQQYLGASSTQAPFSSQG